MAEFAPDSKSLIYGLSDFWLNFFKEVDQLDIMYKGAEINAGQVYLDLLALLLNNSVQDAVIFNKEFFKPITIAEDDLVFRLGSVTSENRYRFFLPDNTVDGQYLNNKILGPTASLERDVDYYTNSALRSFDFITDPTNAYAERVFGTGNSAFRVRSKVPGTVGTTISVELLDNGTAPVSVTATGYSILIEYDGPANSSTGTSALIVQALNTTAATQALVFAELTSLSDGSGVPTGAAAAFLLKVSKNPLVNYALRLIEKFYGGRFTANDVTNWVTEGVEKGDTLRIISGAGVALPTEYDIRLVREDYLYTDISTPFVESDISTNYAVLRTPANPDVVGETFFQSGIVTQSAADGIVDAPSSSFASPSIALSPVHTGELIALIGALNNGYATILSVTSPTSASIGGISLTTEAPLTWQLVSILDPVNVHADGVLVNNGDGTGTFTSALATFTGAAVSTVLRIYRAGLLENYAITGFTDPNTITVAIDADVADGAALDWGWARFKTPVNQLTYAPPLAWPDDGSVFVRARSALTGELVKSGIDYSVSIDTGRVNPLTVWDASVTNTVDYSYKLAVKANTVALQTGANGTITPGTPNVFSSPTAVFDSTHVGYAIEITNSGSTNNGTHFIASVLGPTSVELTDAKFVSSTPDPNNGSLGWELLARGVATAGTDISTYINEMSFWAPDALVDRYNLYNTFGYLINKFSDSSEEYRAFIRGVFQLFMLGPTLERFESAVNTVAGIPVARDENELLLGYDSGATQSGADGFFDFTSSTFTAASAAFTPTDGDSFIYAVDGPNAGTLFKIVAVNSATEVTLDVSPTTSGPHNWELTSLGVHTVTTSSREYEFPRAVPLRADVVDPANVGLLTFRAFETFSTIFNVTDYVEDPDWWEYVQIPEELMPYAGAGRRQSTPLLFENVVDPADEGKVGDPGFIIGSDSEGFTPTATFVRTGAADGVLTPDPGYPSSSFDTFFDSASAAFVASDIGNSVRIAGVDYRITEVVSAVRVRIETFLPITAATGLAWEIYTSPLPKRNKAAFVILDKFLKYHLFTVDFDTALLSLIKADFFSDLQDLVFTARPTHTYIILSPSSLFEEIIFIEEELLFAKTLSLGGSYGETILGNENALLIIGSSWKLGSWYRYVDNSSNFAAPLASVPDVLGVPAGGFSNYVTKFVYDHAALTSGGTPVEDADLVYRDSLVDTGVAAEITVGGNEATLVLDGTVRDNMLTSFITLSGSGLGNDGRYRVGAVDPSTNTVEVYAPAGLALEAGLTWTLTMSGSVAGRVYLDTDAQSFFEDTTASRPFDAADIGQYIRFPFPGTRQNTYRIHALTADPYVVRVALVNQVDPSNPGTVLATLDGATNFITVNTPGDLLFDSQMATEDRGSSDRIFYAVLSSGPNTGERRQILRWVDADTVLLNGALLAADAAVALHVEVEIHYSEAVPASDWQHVSQQVQIDVGDIDLSNCPPLDAAVVTYDAEGVREPDDPTVSVFDDTNGDTLYSIGMQDPKANNGRSRTSRDVDLRDEPIQITRA